MKEATTYIDEGDSNGGKRVRWHGSEDLVEAHVEDFLNFMSLNILAHIGWNKWVVYHFSLNKI